MPPRPLQALGNWAGAASTLWGREGFWHMGELPQAAVFYGIELGSIGLALTSIAFTARRHPVVAVFSLAALGIAILSNVPQSAVRYMMVLPSNYLFLADLGRYTLLDRAWSLVSILLLGLLVTLFSFDFWVA